MQRFFAPFLVALLAAAPVAAKEPVPDSKAVVASRGGVSVTLAELDARMAEIPAESRGVVIGDPRRMEAIVDEMLLIKQIAREGRTTGTDKDPRYQQALALLTDRLLAAFRSEELLKNAPKADAETLVHESYLADPARFTEPEKVRVRHVLIRTGPGCRTKQMSREIAEKVRSEALAGKDFAELARTYSEDDVTKDNGGELPAFGHGQMLKTFETAASRTS